jgi:DnaJ-class molecular chaperone
MEKQQQQQQASVPVVSMSRSYYDILGVSNSASTTDINEAYESLAYAHNGGQKELGEKDMEAYHNITKVSY